MDSQSVKVSISHDPSTGRLRVTDSHGNTWPYDSTAALAKQSRDAEREQDIALFDALEHLKNRRKTT